MIHIFKLPPKTKHISSAYSTLPTRKRKRNQRQREQQCTGSLARSQSLSSDETKHKRYAVAYRLARLNRARRQWEQEHDTAARRQLRVEHLLRKSDELVCFPIPYVGRLHAVCTTAT